MTPPRHRWIAALVVLALASPLRADYMAPWTYSWTTTTPTIAADNPSTGSVTLTPDTTNTATPNSSTTLVAAGITLNSSAAATLNTAGAYQLALKITDTTSGQSHTFDFTGKLSGNFSPGSAMVGNSFDSATPQSFTLGSTTYSVVMNSYAHPGPPGSSASGTLGASVTIAALAGGNPGTTSINSPEPSSLLLGGLGLAGCAFARWRRRRTQRLTLAAR
jgi:hypothetical protein